MSVTKVTITEDHLKLLKNLQWSLGKDGIIMGVKDEGDGIAPPFGMNTIYEAIDLILNGASSVAIESDDDLPSYSQEQIEAWDKLYSELPLVLDVILFRGNFDTGTFRTKYHIRDWKKI